jgi:hypothetical protein
MPYYFESTDDVYDLYRTNVRRIDGVVQMRGKFQAAKLDDYCYDFIFLPTEDGNLTHVIPVFKGCSIIDIVAVCSDCWGAVTGQGTHLGTLADPLRVYDTPDSWLAGEDGVLPLAKSFFKSVHLANSIVARNAEQIAELAFFEPAERFGLDVSAAQQAVLDKISF